MRDKHWKFSFADLKEREHWGATFDEALQHTSTPWAPWWVIPADHKWVARALVAGITTHAIKALKLKRPTVTAEQKRLIAAAKRQLG